MVVEPWLPGSEAGDDDDSCRHGGCRGPGTKQARGKPCPPGGNLTGNSILDFDLALKRLGLVKEVVPNATSVGLLEVPGTQLGPAAESGARDVDDAAASLGMRMHRFGIRE